MGPMELLERHGTALVPKINAELIDKSVFAYGAALRYEATEVIRTPGKRPWTKHTFAMPGGGYVAVGGDKALNGLLARCKVGDLVGLHHKGMTSAEIPEHQWDAFLVTAKGDDLRAIIYAFEPVYTSIREAVEHAAAKRRAKQQANAGPAVDREFSDDEVPR